MASKREKSKYNNLWKDMKEGINNAILSDIHNAILEINHGSVQIHIQDGKVVQIDKVSKVRMR